MFFCSVECIKLLPQDTKEEIKPAGFLLFLFLLQFCWTKRDSELYKRERRGRQIFYYLRQAQGQHLLILYFFYWTTIMVIQMRGSALLFKLDFKNIMSIILLLVFGLLPHCFIPFINSCPLFTNQIRHSWRAPLPF